MYLFSPVRNLKQPNSYYVSGPTNNDKRVKQRLSFMAASLSYGLR